MEELNNEKTQTNSDTAVAEKVDSTQDGQVSLGKFKDVNALIHAYNSLEAEFTKRCQRIKELEGATKSVDNATAPTTFVAEGVDVRQSITDLDKQNILKEYLQGVLSTKQKAIVMGAVGTGVKTPLSRPKTLDEAGALAREILK